MSRTTIRITYVRRVEAYRIDEVTSDGRIRAELHPPWIDNERFAEHLAGLVAGYRGLEVSRGSVDEDGVVWERGRGTRPAGRVA